MLALFSSNGSASPCIPLISVPIFRHRRKHLGLLWISLNLEFSNWTPTKLITLNQTVSEPKLADIRSFRPNLGILTVLGRFKTFWTEFWYSNHFGLARFKLGLTTKTCSDLQYTDLRGFTVFVKKWHNTP